MALIWCAISGHGFGHAAQVIPVLNELARDVPGLKVILRTTVPEKFFASWLKVPWEINPVNQDIGCVQKGPLRIDVQATWEAYARFHEGWEQRVAAEARAIASRAPNLVLSNISYLAIEAGARAGLPTVALASLSWDEILRPLMAQENQDHLSVVRHIQGSYRFADLLIRLTPGLPMEAFHQRIGVGPICLPLTVCPSAWRAQIDGHPDAPIVLVALGGVPLDFLPYDRIAQVSGYRFLLDLPIPDGFRGLRSTSSLPMGFESIPAIADIVVSKPGYATVVETVMARKPLVYVRRYNFAEEALLVEFSHRFGRSAELSKEDFFAGAWKEALDEVWARPFPEACPPESGIRHAAELIAKYL